MKFFIFYGNSVTENSKASLFLKLITKELEDNTKTENIVTRTADNCNLNFINTWKDVLDKSTNPQRETIRKELLDADTIIFITPVFLHNVSAFSKLFLDNFADWSHTMPLIGKQGVPISLSSTNGNEYANDYLKKILGYWGLSTLEPTSLELSEMSEEAMTSYVRYIVRNIYYKSNDLNKLTTELQEDIFRVNRKLLMECDENNLERIEFERNGNAKFLSFRDSLNDKIKINIK